jgi:sulfate adenylyltransferase
MSIAPHGGTLVNRVLSGTEREVWLAKAESMEFLTLNEREMADVEMIGDGAMSPLTGFMTRADYESVVRTMRLASGLAWSIPVTLSVKASNQDRFKEGEWIALRAPDRKRVVGVMHLEEKYAYNRDEEAGLVYLTQDKAHPGVDALQKQGEFLLGGKVWVLNRVEHEDFTARRNTPAQLRKLFADRGWKRVVAFQTRNPIHRAHEYLQKTTLEMCDGLLIHPLMGYTKGDDTPADVRMKCYEALIENYFPKDRVVLSVFPANMRYAGPREAIFHALVRKNYGCTHFIVGRDHAGVGNYYGTYDAHLIFDKFSPQEIGITPLFFEHAFYCKACGSMSSTKTCPHGKEHHVFLSGTKVREMLQKGEDLPVEFTRPEVAKILMGK